MRNRSSLIWGDILFLSLFSLVGFSLFLGAAPLFDWDEINFAECAREMLESGNYLQVQINFKPFWEKPPLFIWMQALSMQLFGVNEFAARFPNALMGVATLLTLYTKGFMLSGRLFARVLSTLYAATLLPVIYFKTGIIDPTFNFFIFLALIQIFEFEYLFFQYKQKQIPQTQLTQSRLPWLIGFCLGLAVLTKGPAALVVVFLTYFGYKLWADRLSFHGASLLKAALMMFATAFLWYGVEAMVHGSWFLAHFFRYQLELLTQPVAGHQQPFYYHFVVFLIGCFPLSIFTFRAMLQRYQEPLNQRLKIFMNAWFWVVMILFSLSQTKIVHYASLLYFPAAFVSALYLCKAIQNQTAMRWESYLIYGLGMLVWGVAPSLVNVAANHLDMLFPYIHDIFAKGNLTMEVKWSGWEWLVGGLFLVGLLVNLSNLIHKHYLHFLYLQTLLCLFFVNAQFKVLLPKIARYTQGASQDFYTQLSQQDVYYYPVNHRSYIPYFYGKVRPQRPESYDEAWLLNGANDKDIYASTRNNLMDDNLRAKLKDFEVLYEKGGFVFFRKKKNAPSL